jgi:hypothetical protein
LSGSISSADGGFIWAVKFDKFHSGAGETKTSMLALITLLAQSESRWNEPLYFAVILVGLILIGAVGWLVAAVLGFARAKAFGPAIKWFAFSAVSMVIYHLWWLIIAYGQIQNDSGIALGFGAFFNLFVVISAVCSIVGFIKLTSTR